MTSPRRVRVSRPKALAAIGAAALFAGSYVAAKVATRELEPLATTLLRYLIAALFLCALAAARHGTSWRIRRADLPWVGFLGLSGILGYHYFFFLALRYTEAANTAVVNAFSPVVTAVLAALLLSERLPARSYAGIVLSVAGVLLLLSRGEWGRLAARRINRGDALMLLSVVSWAAYALVIRRLSTRYTSLTLSLGATLAGVALLIPLALFEGLPGQVAHMSGRCWWAIAYMGIAASGAGYLLYNVSIAEIGPTRTSSLVYSTVPVLVAALSWAILDEPISFTLVTSAVLILLGLQLTLVGPPRGTPQAGETR